MPMQNIAPRSGRGRIVPATLFLAAAVPFLASLGFHWHGPTAQPPAAAPPKPSLVFEQYLVDLGPVPPRPFEYARFAFTNRGDAPVTIRDLEPSCGCLNPQLEKRLYQPGESGDFFLRVVTTREKPGPQKYYVKVLYDDPRPQEVDLGFRLVLPEKQVTIRPPGKIFYQFSADPIEEQFVITDYREHPLEASGIKCDCEWVTATLGPAESDEAGNRRYRVSVTVSGNLPEQRFQPVLVITTNDPQYERLTVPLIIEGRRSAGSTAQTANRLPLPVR